MEYVVGALPKDSIIIDPFMGSGTTGVACKELGYSIEDIHKRFMENAEIKRFEYDVKKITETNLGLEKY